MRARAANFAKLPELLRRRGSEADRPIERTAASAWK